MSDEAYLFTGIERNDDEKPLSRRAIYINQRNRSGGKVVGAKGFEPPTPTPPAWCATRLRYAPTQDATGS